MWLSVPSTRAYAMKPHLPGVAETHPGAFSTLNSGLRDETLPVSGRLVDAITFSTLNSGLRDETNCQSRDQYLIPDFQYPQLGPTR